MRQLLLACCWLCLTWLLPGCGQADQPQQQQQQQQPQLAQATQASQTGAALPVIRQQQLPPEARHTLQLIEAGGPFPFDRDDIVFSNFERLLPQQARGYYREYTVPTPGLKHRGARRIVAGKATDERYYTADHYRSFRRIVP
ncbi:MAG: hypothetical protein KUL75_06025 [Sterolibacterium sp.]|nr:hypothetical protein [Sterolibacterium sp.]